MLSTKGKGCLAGAIAGACAICIAVCAQIAAPLPHSPEQAQGITAEEASKPIEPEKLVAGGGESARSGRDQAHAAADSAVATFKEASSDEPEGIPEAATRLEDGTSGSSRQQSSGAANPADNASDTSKRKWVIDYKDVWVEDVEDVIDTPEHTEPLYGTVDVLICNACGHTCEDGNAMGAHLSQHALEGVDEGYRSAPEQVQVGEKTVPATYKTIDRSHFERVENGGHWE